MYITLHNNMFVSLYFSPTIGTTGGGVQEEPLLVFTNRDMACGHANKLGIQKVSKPNK